MRTASAPSRTLARAMTPAVCMLALMVGCGGRAESTDPGGRIRYTPPEGWELIAASGGTRYRPVDGLNLATIQIATIADDREHDLRAEKHAWLEFQARSGQEILVDRQWSDDHHHGHEYVHTVETIHGSGVWHHLLVRGDGYRVAAHLQTTTDRYPADRDVFERVVASIRPTTP